MAIEFVVAGLAVATTGYAIYKHITLATLKSDYAKIAASIKAEVAKLEASASSLEVAAKAEVVKIEGSVVADVKVAIAAIKSKL
jgi:hypothetical protein